MRQSLKKDKRRYYEDINIATVIDNKKFWKSVKF